MTATQEFRAHMRASLGDESQQLSMEALEGLDCMAACRGPLMPRSFRATAYSPPAAPPRLATRAHARALGARCQSAAAAHGTRWSRSRRWSCTSCRRTSRSSCARRRSTSVRAPCTRAAGRGPRRPGRNPSLHLGRRKRCPHKLRLPASRALRPPGSPAPGAWQRMASLSPAVRRPQPLSARPCQTDQH